MSFDPVTYSAVQQLKKESDSIPVGFSARIASPFIIAEDSAGRVYLRSGHIVPAEQAPNVPDDLYMRGVEFESRSIPSTGHFESVTYADGLFVAVARGGGDYLCATSLDGITWTSRTMPSDAYYSVTYADGLFVAVGSSRCATSPDGITWTARTIPSGNYTSVTYADGLFVAVGTGGACATSPILLFAGIENYEQYLYMRIS